MRTSTICMLLAAQKVNAGNWNLSKQLNSSFAQVSQESISFEDFTALQLEAHNEYRANHGAPALTYDADLAAEAQDWANKLNEENTLYHSTAEGYGENLAYYKSSNDQTTIDTIQESTHATDAWYNEVTAPGYHFDNPGYNQNPGTGHFTQVVWRGSDRLGCGVAGSVAVCRYIDAGNFLGRFEDNVLPAGTEYVDENAVVEPEFCMEEQIEAEQYQDAEGAWCENWDLCADGGDADAYGEECPREEGTQDCSEAAFGEELFQDGEGNWCEGQDLCADEDAETDAYGDACPVEEEPVDPLDAFDPTLQALLEDYISDTYKYSDGSAPGDKLAKVYTDYDFIPGLPLEEEDEEDEDEDAQDDDNNDDNDGDADQEDNAEGEDIDDDEDGNDDDNADDSNDNADNNDNQDNQDDSGDDENADQDDSEQQNNDEDQQDSENGAGVFSSKLPAWMQAHF